ncbi:hypothetical protein [Shewanella putrefaciens]|nr:hypothetical protein [Shewanella putrefaciens]
MNSKAVILANAGIQLLAFELLAFRTPKDITVDSRLRGNDEGACE